MRSRGSQQTRGRFVQRFVTEAKSSVMHRDQSLGLEFDECLHRLLWIHMNFATSGRVVSADRKQRDVDFVALPDFLEPGKVGAVAAMKNGSAID